MQSNIDSIVDYLFTFSGVHYISDMPRLPRSKRQTLARIVKTIPLDAASLHAWNDAVCYLVHGSPSESRREARNTLIAALAA